MVTTIQRALRSVAGAAVILVWSAAAMAHDEAGHADPQLAESVAPGVTALGILVIGAVLAGIWVRMRRLAMLRALKLDIEAAAKPASSEPDARS